LIGVGDGNHHTVAASPADHRTFFPPPPLVVFLPTQTPQRRLRQWFNSSLKNWMTLTDILHAFLLSLWYHFHLLPSDTFFLDPRHSSSSFVLKHTAAPSAFFLFLFFSPFLFFFFFFLKTLRKYSPYLVISGRLPPPEQSHLTLSYQSFFFPADAFPAFCPPLAPFSLLPPPPLIIFPHGSMMPPPPDRFFGIWVLPLLNTRVTTMPEYQQVLSE